MPVVLALGLASFAFSTYIVWPSRWNVPAHLQVGFAITAYVLPLLMTDVLSHYDRALTGTLTAMVCFGAVANIIGVVVGGGLPRIKLLRIPFSFKALSSSDLTRFSSRRATILFVGALAGLIVSFMVMGFVPMFAAKPYAAKFFRGEYQDSYLPVAIPFRSSYYIVVTLIPILGALWYETRRLKYAALLAVGAAAITATLNRGPLGEALLLLVGVLAARKSRRWSLLYLVAVPVVYFVGSTYYYLLSEVLGILEVPKHYSRVEPGIFALAAAGSPDIMDAFTLLSAFLARGAFTYGRTFFGGLVPFHYQWNPAVWTLSVISGGDVNRLVSGGVRLPVPLWGYTAFGWPGTVLVPFLSGLISGYGAAFARKNVMDGGVLRSMVALVLYATVVGQIARFYILSIYGLPALVAALAIAYKVRVSVAPRVRGWTTAGAAVEQGNYIPAAPAWQRPS